MIERTIQYRSSSCIPREVIDRPLLLREVGRTTSFRIMYPTLLATYMYNMYKISYNYKPLASIWNQFPHGILRFYWWRGQERIPPIPIELLSCDLVLGVHPASATSNLKKGVNTYIWMKLNTNDGNKIKLWILLLTHFILFFRVAPLRGRGVVDELANVVSTIIILGFLPQALYEK